MTHTLSTVMSALFRRVEGGVLADRRGVGATLGGVLTGTGRGVMRGAVMEFAAVAFERLLTGVR